MGSKKFRVVYLAVAGLLLLGFASFLFSRNSQLVSQTRSSPLAATPAAAPAARDLPPGTIAYTPKANTTALAIARKYLSESTYMTAPEFEAAIRQANNGKASFKKNEEVLVTGIEPQPVVEKTRPFPKEEEIRAIYLTGATAGSMRGVELIRRWHKAGGNAVVFDIKDSDGSINVPFDHPLAPKKKNYSVTNLPKFVRFLHSQEMHAIARIALFRDENIAKNHSTLAVQSRSTHQAWKENGKLVWTDPSNPQVQDYNIAVRRFPTNMIAGIFGFSLRPFFAAQQGAEKAPAVNFNFGSPAPAASPAATAAATP